MHHDLARSLARRIREHAGHGHGVVVTHGTDTMEETVYLIDRLLPLDAPPVVLTGAQRGAADRDTDGPRNLRNAIRIALTGERGLGAVICFDGAIHAAREVRKVHTSRPGAFASPGYGPLGHVDGERVCLQHRPARCPPLPDGEAPMPRVDLIRLFAGSDATFVRASVGAGSRAIVLEGTGRGNANEQVVGAVAEAIGAGVPVVVASRCLQGRVEPVYGRGGGKDLAEAGAIFAGDLAGTKARVLVQLAIAGGVPVADAIAAEAG
jgi:L-asparaginase